MSEKSFDSVAPFEANFASSNVTSQDGVHLGAPNASAEVGNLTETQSSPKLSTKFSKEESHSDVRVTTTTVQGILPPPLPAPRRGSNPGSSRRRSANPVLGGSTSSESLGGQVSSPLATAKIAPASRSTSTSPISFKVASNGVATSPQHTATSSPSNAVPIAVAIQETCNAIFKGSDMSRCVIKVTGEVMISFAASHVSQLASHEALAFRLSGVDGVERLLHNQHLLKKEGDGYSYKFDMPSLVTNLKQMKEKQNSPYCNIQILKYEVKASSGAQLPLKLVSFWKCESHTTNFRLDYSYQPSSLKQSNKPSLTNITVVVPVSGGVRKSLSKPEGSWVAEQNRIMWKIGDLQPTEEGRGTLHAKFDVVNGPTVPAPATVQFLCDGATMSGLTFELSNDAYKVSLVKNKCLSGKYTSEIVHHY